MITRLSLIVLVAAAFCVPGIQAAEQPSNVAPTEVRLLVDISGSMKQNDPHNLRSPALSLVARMLPDGSRAGVWTFGRMVNALVPLAPVDGAWRERAVSQVGQIRSVALFTNIGGVLEAASTDLKAGASGEGVHFILLTDGMVDISEEPETNARERARILSEVLTPIKRSGARLHTIALSRNADTSLMRSLALETGGLFSVAESSETLSRIFLQALDQAVPAEQAPIENNAFSIDASVQEFTVLAFVEDGAPAVKLVDPAGHRYQNGEHPPSVRWYQDRGYELITVTAPSNGEWKLEADIQEGSRVTLVTDLTMRVSPLPANFFPGDVLELTAAFYEGEERVTSPDFLSVVDVDVTISNQLDLSGTKRISATEQPPADGFYRDVIQGLPELGRYTVSVTADGKTFRRHFAQQIQLNPPIDVELEGAGDHYRLVVIPRSERILVDRTQVAVSINGPDGSKVIRPLSYEAQARRWGLEIEPFGGEGRYQAQLALDGVVEGGQAFNFRPGPLSLDFPRQASRVGEYRSVLNKEEVGKLTAEVTEAILPASVSAEAPEFTELPPVESLVQEKTGMPSERLRDEPATQSVPPTNRMAIVVGAAAGLGGVLLLIGLGLWLRSRRASADDPEETSKGVAGSEVQVSEPGPEPPVMEEDEAAEVEERVEPGLAEPDLVEPESVQLQSWPEQPSSDEEPGMFSVDDEPEEVDTRTPEEIADAILAENQLLAALDEEEFGMEDLDISDTEVLSDRDNEADNKPV